jgi:hypothetical protein
MLIQLIYKKTRKDITLLQGPLGQNLSFLKVHKLVISHSKEASFLRYTLKEWNRGLNEDEIQGKSNNTCIVQCVWTIKIENQLGRKLKIDNPVSVHLLLYQGNLDAFDLFRPHSTLAGLAPLRPLIIRSL